jgi:NAD(P)-dependent dehydrogenase (short-subunit alcohol dehydrogenase family)
MRTVAVSGSASGIGAAVRARLERDGARVVGVDLRDAEVIADLSVRAGREAALGAVLAACDGRLAGVVACAGLGPHVTQADLVVSVNYFGAVALLHGLREALLAGAPAAAVAISSNSSTIAGQDGPLVAACLAVDEAGARAAAITADGQSVYAGSKLALARWVRRHAPQPTWAGAGIRLNAVAPGAVSTPLLDGGLADPVYGDLIRAVPIPTGGFGRPEQIADAVAFLLSPEATFCCGSVLFVDGGSDALIRPDAY